MSDTHTPNRTLSEKQTLLAFGKAVRNLREKKGYSQEDFANLANFSRSYYTEIETGKRNPSLLTIVKTAKALGVSVSKLVNLPEAKDNG